MRISTTDGSTRPMTPTNAFWTAPAPEAPGVAVAEGAGLAASADDAAAELAPLPELVQPASASAAAPAAAKAAGHRRQGGEHGRNRRDECCEGGGEGFSTMHHYRTVRA